MLPVMVYLPPFGLIKLMVIVGRYPILGAFGTDLYFLFAYSCAIGQKTMSLFFHWFIMDISDYDQKIMVMLQVLSV